MSLKHREWIAWVLIVLAAVSWSTGQRILGHPLSGGNYETTAPIPDNTDLPATEVTGRPTYSAQEQHLLDETESEPPDSRVPGFVLCFVGAVMGIAVVFVLRRTSPLLGPDGVLILLALMIWGWYHLYWITDDWFRVLFVIALLTIARELWGWMLSKCSMSWCMMERLMGLITLPQLRILGYTALIVLWVLSGALKLLWVTIPMLVLSIGCLWRYGSDLNHLRRQLKCWQEGESIEVGCGAFSDAEAQLLAIAQQHEEAIQAAVTAERFRVDLIANVSHDLRTPLTSILGCGELLQSEDLSPAGSEQLRRLNQKAGYMRELVDSLFELTKVSSGVVEAKQDQIDLIRLLEQTIGLYDDQLTAADLVVRRNYCRDAMPVITDGGRMHQVFANLLGNAIKYALPGTRIYLEAMEDDAEYRVRMTNTASYEMDFEPNEILQRFARGDKARSTRGSGLGLSIAQTYTESVGGKFSVAVDGDQFNAIVHLPKTDRNL